MSDFPKVRLGGPQDEEPMMELALRAWKENGIRNVNPDKMRSMIKPALFLWEGLVGIIGEPGEKIEAAILLRISQLWYSDDKIVEERAIFVDPEYRKVNRSQKQVGHARALCDFSKKVSTDLNLPLLIGVLSTERTEAKIRLYERNFGHMAGAFFLYNAKSGQHLGAT